MSDGLNDARQLRILEIINDFRAASINATQVASRANLIDPKHPLAHAPPYMLLRHIGSEMEQLKKRIPPDFRGQVPGTEEEKEKLRRTMLQVSSLRFKALQSYLKASAAMRWIQLREQAERGPPGKVQEAMVKINERYGKEIAAITDQYVEQQLRTSDSAKNYWVREDPRLKDIIAWLKSNNVNASSAEADSEAQTQENQ